MSDVRPEAPDRNLAMELVRVTERACVRGGDLAGQRHRERGDARRCGDLGLHPDQPQRSTAAGAVTAYTYTR